VRWTFSSPHLELAAAEGRSAKGVWEIREIYPPLKGGKCSVIQGGACITRKCVSSAKCENFGKECRTLASSGPDRQDQYAAARLTPRASLYGQDEHASQTRQRHRARPAVREQGLRQPGEKMGRSHRGVRNTVMPKARSTFVRCERMCGGWAAAAASQTQRVDALCPTWLLRRALGVTPLRGARTPGG
jgi:hypothetical protein